MTRIDDTQVPGNAGIYKKYQELLRRENLRSTDSKEFDKKSEEMKMAQASRDFEALFIQQMLKEMRRGLNEDSGFEGTLAADKNRNSFFRDQMYQDIAKDMANQGGFGIGAVLFEQLYRQEHLEIPEVSLKQTPLVDAPLVDVLRGPEENSVFQLLEQQEQALQQRQALQQAQLQNRFYN